jgi:hypothetical protein
LNAFTPGVPGVNFCGITEILGGLCTALNGDDLYNALGAKFLRRCPGANERGLNEEELTQANTPYPVNCDPSQTPLGP